MGDYTTFFIYPEIHSKSHTVSIVPKGKTSPVSCTFSYSISEQKQNGGNVKLEKEEPTPSELVKTITAKYPNCFPYTREGWKYEICLGGRITQSLANTKSDDASLSFHLGTFGNSLDKSNALVFDNGQLCSNNAPARKTFLQLTCGSSPQVISLEEPKTCVYRIRLELPDVCGHSGFAQEIDNNEKDEGGPEEAWILELVQTQEGSIACTAQHTGYGNLKGEIYFESFALSFGDNVQVKGKARHSDRSPLQLDEWKIHSQGGGVESTDSFTNNLHYVTLSRTD